MNKRQVDAQSSEQGATQPRELQLEAITIVQKWSANNAIACQSCGLPASTYYLADLIDRALTARSDICASLVEALELIADHAERATLVQDRSVGIIKQICASMAREARTALSRAKGEVK